MKPIFEISNDFLQLLDQVENNDGEITPEIESALAINDGEVKQKSVAYVAVIKTIEADVKIIDEEIKRLQALKKSRGGIVSNLKNRLDYALKLFCIDEIKTELVKINFRKSKIVVIEDIDLLPDSCKNIKVTVIPDKKTIKQLIEDGKNIKGAYIQVNSNLQIK